MTDDSAHLTHDLGAGRPVWLDRLVEKSTDVTWGPLSHFTPPTDGSARESAVLVLLADGPLGPSVVLLERAATMRSHAGQVAFPGGAVDPGDADLSATALREAAEEIGLDPRSVEVQALLPELFLAPSNFVVTPVLAFWRRPHPVRAVDPAEVARVAVVPVAELVDPANRFVVHHPSGYTGPAFGAGGLFVWGFTAGVLDTVLRMGGWQRPWDRSVARALPPPPGTVEA